MEAFLLRIAKCKHSAVVRYRINHETMDLRRKEACGYVLSRGDMKYSETYLVITFDVLFEMFKAVL